MGLNKKDKKSKPSTVYQLKIAGNFPVTFKTPQHVLEGLEAEVYAGSARQQTDKLNMIRKKLSLLPKVNNLDERFIKDRSKNRFNTSRGHKRPSVVVSKGKIRRLSSERSFR